MRRNLNLSPRTEKVREPLVKSAVQFELSEIKEHFDESLNTIRKNFELAEYLISVGRMEESENIYRSQIVFLESILDFFMHEITKFGLYRIFINEWDITEKFNNLEIPMSKVKRALTNTESTEWFFDYINYKYSSEVMQDWSVIRDQLNLIGIEWSSVCKQCNPEKVEKESITCEKNKLKELYKRRNEIAHQNDRRHTDAKQQEISRSYVEEKIDFVDKFVNAIYDIACKKNRYI